MSYITPCLIILNMMLSVTCESLAMQGIQGEKCWNLINGARRHETKLHFEEFLAPRRIRNTSRTPYGLWFPVDCLESFNRCRPCEGVSTMAHNHKFTNWILIKYFRVGHEIIVSRQDARTFFQLCVVGRKNGIKVNGMEKQAKSYIHGRGEKLRHCRNFGAHKL